MLDMSNTGDKSRPDPFPPTPVTAVDHDGRLAPEHSFEYVARLQEVHGDGPNPVLLRVKKTVGHGRGMPTSMRLELEADRRAVVTRHLGAA